MTDPQRQALADLFDLDSLEFAVVRTLLEERLTTPVGRLAVQRLAPLVDEPALAAELAATASLAQRLGPRESLPLAGAVAVQWLASFLRGEHSLAVRELAELKRLLRAGERCRLWLRAGEPALVQFAARAPQLADLVDELERIVDDRGELLDSASPRLATARRDIEQARALVDAAVLHVLNQSEVRKHLQSPEPVWRHGRPVLQVKAEQRHRIAGIQHDRSASGATVFVEPEQVVDAANQLSDAQAREAREIQVVLVEVARQLQHYGADLTAAVEFVACADLLSAKARLCGEGFVVPHVASDAVLRLRGARHPLLLASLRQQPVVPLDVALGDPHRLLVVTGPNTGGKTVVLKTIGLLAAMGQSGVPIPAEAGATLPFLHAIKADIGDEQGISQNLSTFSSHVQRIARCLRRAGRQALVLIDELGAGTDPEEGGVLGYAVLEELVAAGAFAVVTTHLGRLKDFAYRHQGAENGSMTFDGATLQPLYRLVVGIPGNSHALDIAHRVGMPAPLVARARELLGKRDQSLELVLQRVQVARQEAEADRQRSADLSRDVASQKAELAARMAHAVRKESWVQEEADAVVEAELRAAQQALLPALQALQNAPGKHGEQARELKQVVENLLKNAALHRRRMRFCLGLKKGDAVYLPRFARVCEVSKVDKVREVITVEYGKVKMEVPFEDASWLQPLDGLR